MTWKIVCSPRLQPRKCQQRASHKSQVLCWFKLRSLTRSFTHAAVIPGALAFSVHLSDEITRKRIEDYPNLFFFSSDYPEHYNPFCADFGPVNLGVRKSHPTSYKSTLASRAPWEHEHLGTILLSAMVARARAERLESRGWKLTWNHGHPPGPPPMNFAARAALAPQAAQRSSIKLTRWLLTAFACAMAQSAKSCQNVLYASGPLPR